MIKDFKTFAEAMLESNQVHQYGCAMVYFDFPYINELHKWILPEHLYTEEADNSYGAETEPHVTLLFGIHDGEVQEQKVIELCKSKPIGAITLHNASLFESENYDVLKYDAVNDVLYEINRNLSQLPHTTSFPDYHPHSTVAYIKKGFGKMYAEKLAGQTHSVVPKQIVYSKPNGTRVVENFN
jgi:hypothetical protein